MIIQLQRCSLCFIYNSLLVGLYLTFTNQFLVTTYVPNPIYNEIFFLSDNIFLRKHVLIPTYDVSPSSLWDLSLRASFEFLPNSTYATSNTRHCMSHSTGHIPYNIFLLVVKLVWNSITNIITNIRNGSPSLQTGRPPIPRPTPPSMRALWIHYGAMVPWCHWIGRHGWHVARSSRH